MEIVSLDKYEKDIVAGKRRGLMGAIQIGMALEAIRSGNLWLNTGAKSFEKWAAAAHGFGRSSIYNMINVATKFGKYILADPSLQSIEPTRLIRLLPFVDESNSVDLLHSSSQIPDTMGFDNYLRSLQNKVCTDDPHDCIWEAVPYEVCTVCNAKRKKIDKVT